MIVGPRQSGLVEELAMPARHGDPNALDITLRIQFDGSHRSFLCEEIAKLWGIRDQVPVHFDVTVILDGTICLVTELMLEQRRL